MSILLEPKRIFDCVVDCGCEQGCKKCHTVLVKAQARKIALELQIIHSIPDFVVRSRRMGEFIKKLMEEVK